MSTWHEENARRRYAAVMGTYLLCTVLCALFGAVYERFSHGVWSYFMVYAFAFPLLLGLMPFFLLQKKGRPFPGLLSADFIHAGVAALTAGSILKGILDIYGTASPLLLPCWIAGGVLCLSGWLLALRGIRNLKP